MALNGLLAVTLPTLALARAGAPRGDAARRRRARPGRASATGCSRLGRGAALPLALQAVYLVCLPFAAREGVGAVTSFGYAYLAASALVGGDRPRRSASSRRSRSTRIGLDPGAGRAPRRRRPRGSRSSRPGRRRGSLPSPGRRSRRGARRRLRRRRRGGDRAPVVALVAVDGLLDRVLGHAPAPLRPGLGRACSLVGLALLALHVPLAWLGQASRRASRASRSRSLPRPSLAVALDAPPPPRGSPRRSRARKAVRVRLALSGSAFAPARAPRRSGRRRRAWVGAAAAFFAVARPPGLRQHGATCGRSPEARVTAVVLSWNGTEETLACLSLQRATTRRCPSSS